MKRKKILFLIPLFCMLIFFIPGTVFAADEYDEGITAENVDSAYPESISDGKVFNKTAYDWMREIVQNKISENCEKALNGTLFSSTGLNTVMEDLYTGVKSLGLALLAMYFLIELFEKSTRANFGLEEFIRMLAKYFVMKTLYDNGYRLLTALMGIGDALVGGLQATSVSATGIRVLNQIGHQLGEGNLVSRMMTYIVIILLYFVFKILGLVIEAICFSRLIELTLRGGFMPIGCASMAQEGFSGHGLRYLKKYFGVCLRGVVIVAVLHIGSTFSASLMSNADVTSLSGTMSYVFGVILVQAVEVMAILKTEQVAVEIAGV